MNEWGKAYRRLRNIPNYWKEGRLTSAIFKDENGVSVDLDFGRNESDIIKDEERLHEHYFAQMLESKFGGVPTFSSDITSINGMTPLELADMKERYRLVSIISVEKTICDREEVYVEPAPVKDINQYHALLKKSKDIIKLTRHQCKVLADNSKVVVQYQKEG